MKRVFDILTVLLAACVMAFTGCSPDELSTEQYADKGVALNVYGPQPVVRGGQLRFLGSNLDQVTAVILPGVDPITEIKVVQAGVPSEIRITVPKEGPEPGFVTLVTADGQEITTKTELEFLETVVIESIEPLSVKPGDVITIKGEYLDLMHEVIFTDDVHVNKDEFEVVPHSRYEIKVKVPEEARTGKVSLSDLGMNSEDPENPMTNYATSEEELVVAGPQVSKPVTGNVHAGQELTITGSNFMYVDHVEIPGAEISEFKINEDGTILTFTLPQQIQLGEIILVAKSGEEIPAGTIQVKVPTELSVSPSPVKAGQTLTISGKDMDMVTGVSLPASGNVESPSITSESVSFTVPAEAQEGNITLNLNNGVSITVAYTLVKPVVISYNAESVAVGEELVISGTDLDLVTGVTFGGNVSVDVTASQGSIEVTVPSGAVTGALALNLANGTSVSGPELEVEPEPVDENVFWTWTGSFNSANWANDLNPVPDGFDWSTVNLSESKVELVLQLTDVVADAQIVLQIPAGSWPQVAGSSEVKPAAGQTEAKIEFNQTMLDDIMTNGGFRIKGKNFSVTKAELRKVVVSDDDNEPVSGNILWEGNTDLGNSWAVNVQVTNLSELPYEAVIHVAYTVNANASNAQLKLMSGADGWPVLTSVTDADPTYGTVNVAADGEKSYKLNNADVDAVKASSLIISGRDLTITKVYWTEE